MKRKYEGLIILSTRGKEESIEKIISKVGNEMESQGARLEQIDQIGRRKFPYKSKNREDGFYVNYQFEAEPEAIEKLRDRLDLDTDVHQQQYRRLS
jgi:small subunit ribosomal protein S6